MVRFLKMPKEIYALFFVRFIVSAGNFVNPFLAMILTLKLGYDQPTAGIFMSAVAVIGAAGLMIGGKLGDGIGRRRTLIVLQTVTAAAYIACAATGFTPFMPFVIAFALGILNGTWPVINAVTADVTNDENRKDAFALLYWGNNVGFSVGPLMAGFLFSAAPLLMFAGSALALTFAALAVFFFVRETKPSGNAHASAHAPSSGKPKEESTIRVLLSEPVLLAYALLCVLAAFVYNQHVFALPIFLSDLLGPTEGPKAFGAAMTVNGLTVVIATLGVGFLSRKIPMLACMTLSSGIYILGFGSYAFSTGLPSVLASTALWTIGEILGATNGNAFVAERAAESHRSRINSAISLCYIAGAAIAPLAAGFLAKHLGSRAIWFPVAGAAALLTVGNLILWRKDDKKVR